MTHTTQRLARRLLLLGGAAAAGLLTGGSALAGRPLIEMPPAGELVLARIAPSAAPEIDGTTGDAAWRRATPMVVATHRGFGAEGVPVTLRAVQDGRHAYFSFSWPDATRSQKHRPLQKTADGWRLLDDPARYAEDKLVVQFSPGGGDAPPSAAIAARPAADLWSWRSVRTGAVGQIDDDHVAAAHGLVRARAGDAGAVAQDPAGGGGVLQNWITLPDGRVRPRFLPKEPEMLGEMGAIDLDPAVSDRGEWWLAKDDTQPWRPELETGYPPGTVVPSVVIDGPVRGDRGDVEAVADWRDGRWTLEVKRRLHTGSPYDLPLATGLYLWLAVYDHAEIGESRQLRPVRLRL